MFNKIFVYARVGYWIKFRKYRFLQRNGVSREEFCKAIKYCLNYLFALSHLFFFMKTGFL